MNICSFNFRPLLFRNIHDFDIFLGIQRHVGIFYVTSTRYPLFDSNSNALDPFSRRSPYVSEFRLVIDGLDTKKGSLGFIKTLFYKCN